MVGRSKKGAGDEGPVLNLKMDSSSRNSEPREVGLEGDDQQTPCILTGVMAGVSGGTLGYVLGFGGYWMRNRLKGKFGASLGEAWGSARTFATMGGLYAAVNCFAKRIRQKDDAWNGAVSGCATGLALGWNGGPASALQSCAMLGAFSFFVDGMAGPPPAQAAAVGAAAAGGSPSSGEEQQQQYVGGGRQQQQGGGWQERGPLELLLSPAVPLLAALAPCQFGDPEVTGCRVLRRR